MKIGVYLGNHSPEIGGGFTFQDDIYNAFLDMALSQSQHTYTIISTHINSTQKTVQENTNLTFRYLKPSSLFFRIISWFKYAIPPLSRFSFFKGPLAKLAKQEKLDIVWFISGGGHEVLEVPYVATVWDLQHRLQPWFPEVSQTGQWLIREFSYQQFLQRAAYVIVGTDAGRDEVNLFYQIPEFRIIKLPHPTPRYALQKFAEVDSEVLKKYNLPSNYIFYPAQFWAHKNHVNLLYALAKIKDDLQLQIPLVLSGSDKGNLSHIMNVATQLGIKNQVYLIGFIPQNHLPFIYKNASMMAYVSLCGPENLPPLEAFALGCPVLASKVSGSTEQFGDAVIYCDPVNIEDIASGILKLQFDSDARKILCEKGYERAAAWTSQDFVSGLFTHLDRFSIIRRAWD